METKFEGFGKIPRLSRDCIITEKIDGTNASVEVLDCQDPVILERPHVAYSINGYYIYAGSRTRWITPEADNYGFARWVWDNAEELTKLGHGKHFGEWWGKGIQRGYNQISRRFSLFNTARWSDPLVRPVCCDVVPVLYEGMFDTGLAEGVVGTLRNSGSMAAPGYPFPEGIIFHKAGNLMFKKTVEKDDEPKEKSARLGKTYG